MNLKHEAVSTIDKYRQQMTPFLDILMLLDIA